MLGTPCHFAPNALASSAVRPGFSEMKHICMPPPPPSAAFMMDEMSLGSIFVFFFSFSRHSMVSSCQSSSSKSSAAHSCTLHKAAATCARARPQHALHQRGWLSAEAQLQDDVADFDNRCFRTPTRFPDTGAACQRALTLSNFRSSKFLLNRELAAVPAATMTARDSHSNNRA